jgi:hypothetical protein
MESKVKNEKGRSSMLKSIEKWKRGRPDMSVREEKGMFDRVTSDLVTSDQLKIETTLEMLQLKIARKTFKVAMAISDFREDFSLRMRKLIIDERGDVPGWVLVVLMTTGLVTGIWTIAAPRIESLLRGSLDSMNSVR